MSATNDADATERLAPVAESWQWEAARWENVYRYATDSYKRVEERWSAADEKAWKYLSILGIVIGAGALTSPQIARTVARPGGYLDALFICATVSGLGFVLASFFSYLKAIELKQLQAPPTRDDMFNFLQTTQYFDVLLNLGRDTLKAADRARIELEGKLKWADNGFQFMRLAGICLLVAYLAFFAIQVREARKSGAQGGKAVSSASTTRYDEQDAR